MGKFRHLSRVLMSDIQLFFRELSFYILKLLRLQFFHFETGKKVFVGALYRQRGRMAKRLMHSGMAGIAAFGIMVAPVVAEQIPNSGIDPWEAPSPSSVLSASTDQYTSTEVANKDYRDKVIDYTVEEGDTISTVAEKFGVSEDTIRWENDLGDRDVIKVGQTLHVLPITGVSHTVKKGDTVYSIAQKYDVDAQQIVNYPFNTFVNDETFELAIGQTLMVPEGVIAAPVSAFSPVASTRSRQTTPDAGTVTASGQFIWPASGSITTNFVWYHQGIDIANRAAPNILAADSGTVVVAGWPDNWGYGNRVIIDHGNGTRTLYAHLSAIYVVPGQTVARGAAIGRMGTTGRSTGIHLHFEVIRNGVHINPLSVL